MLAWLFVCAYMKRGTVVVEVIAAAKRDFFCLFCFSAAVGRLQRAFLASAADPIAVLARFEECALAFRSYQGSCTELVPKIAPKRGAGAPCAKKQSSVWGGRHAPFLRKRKSRAAWLEKPRKNSETNGKKGREGITALWVPAFFGELFAFSRKVRSSFRELSPVWSGFVWLGVYDGIPTCTNPTDFQRIGGHL